jgi:hypothetical protein
MGQKDAANTVRCVCSLVPASGVCSAVMTKKNPYAPDFVERGRDALLHYCAIAQQLRNSAIMNLFPFQRSLVRMVLCHCRTCTPQTHAHPRATKPPNSPRRPPNMPSWIRLFWTCVHTMCHNLSSFPTVPTVLVPEKETLMLFRCFILSRCNP